MLMTRWYYTLSISNMFIQIAVTFLLAFMKAHTRGFFSILLIIFFMMTAGQPRKNYDALTLSGKRILKLRFEQAHEKLKQGLSDRYEVQRPTPPTMQPPKMRCRYHPVEHRKRARLASRQQVINTLKLRVRTKATENAHIEARERMNCWRNKVSDLDIELLEGCDMTTTPQGAAMSPFQALDMSLYLAERDECMNEGDYSPSLLLFVDACNPCGDRNLKSPVLVFSLPEAKSPHQTTMRRAIARYVGPDDGHHLKGLLDTHTMVPAVEKALTRGVNGEPLRLKTYQDLAQMNTFLGTHGPQCNDCCPFCPATQEELVLPTFTGAQLRTLGDWIATSPVPEVLRLFKHENDIGWDTRHLCTCPLSIRKEEPPKPLCAESGPSLSFSLQRVGQVSKVL